MLSINRIITIGIGLGLAIAVNLAMLMGMPLLTKGKQAFEPPRPASRPIWVTRYHQPKELISKDKTPEQPSGNRRPPSLKPQVARPSAPTPQPPGLAQPRLTAALNPRLTTVIELPPLATQTQDIDFNKVFLANETDQPPRTIYAPRPAYPFLARRQGLEGEVVLRILINKNGEVEEIIVERAEPAGLFEDTARQAVSRWRFEPAQVRGQAVRAWRILPIRFTLK